MKRRLIVLLSVFILIIIYACTPQEIDGTNQSHNPNQEFDTGDSGNPVDDDKDSTLLDDLSL